ncbi:MAG: site-specific integrase [Candidatus Nanopelagicales bacterium]
MATRAENGEVVLAKGATLRTWVAEWLPERAGRRRRESTVSAYAYRLNTYVLPLIGGIRLRELTSLDVEDMAHALARKGLSHSTIKGCLVALSACLHDAKRGSHLATNPAVGVEVPETARPTAEASAPTIEQVAALLDKVGGTYLEALSLLLLSTGARIGEALAARWSEVDLDSGSWLVSQTLTRGRDGSVRIGDRRKSGDGRRLSLSPDAVTALREQRRRVAQARLHAGGAWHDHDLVFPSSIGTPQDSSNVRADFRPVAASVGWPGSFHAFRHFVASVGLSALPTAVVSKQLGHKRATLTTDVYGHLLPDDSAQVAALVSGLVSRQRAAK